MDAKLAAVADRVMAAQDAVSMLEPITAGAPDFNVADGYMVLAEIERRRRAQGWQAVGRKIGFTSRRLSSSSSDPSLPPAIRRSFCPASSGSRQDLINLTLIRSWNEKVWENL
jgi:hypothetical protein